MAWRDLDWFYTGESQDDPAERFPAALSVVSASDAMAQTGGWCLLLPTQSIGAKAYVRGSYHQHLLDYIDVLSGAFALDNAPIGSEIRLVSSASPGGPLNTAPHYAGIGTDRKLRIYDRNGTQHGPASTTLIPLVGNKQELHIIFDGLTLPTVFVKVYFSQTEEMAFDTGMAYTDFFENVENRYLYWGEVPAAGRGTPLYGDDLYMRRADAAGDAPHLVRYPRYRGVGSITQTPPTANGDEVDWTNDYQAVDELNGNDGDTTHIESTATSEKELYHYTAANPIPANMSVLKLQQRLVHRLTGAEKLGHQLLHKLAGVEGVEEIALPGVVYRGGGHPDVSRPGGGPWARADADLDAGQSKVQFGLVSAIAGDIGSRVTLMGGPEWIYYDDVDGNKLELGTTPVPGLRERGVLRGVERGVVRGV